MTITASATAELTFSDGFDFEATEDEDDDESIADELVEESCGHLDGSYVSYVERDEDDLMVNAEITQSITVTVPWNSTTRLREVVQKTDQTILVLENLRLRKA